MERMALAMFLGICLTGCGPSKADLRKVDGFLATVEQMDCNNLKANITALRQQLQDKLK